MVKEGLEGAGSVKEGIPIPENPIVPAARALGRNKMQSVLLQVYDEVAEARTPSDVFDQYLENRFLPIANISQREMMRVDDLIYRAVPSDFKDVIISPVSPLGINKVLTRLSQKNVLSTVRNVEVVAAITPSLALEAARRRKENGCAQDDSAEVHLCSSHRNIRAQLLAKNETLSKFGFTPHFQLFALASAGYAMDKNAFSGKMLEKHLKSMLDFFRLAKETGEYDIGEISVSISDILAAVSLINTRGIDRNALAKETTNEDASIFKVAGVDLPDHVQTLCELSPDVVSRAGLTVVINNLRHIEESVLPSLRQNYSEVAFDFHLSRIAGMGYYNGVCYKIYGTNSAGEKYPLLDGGSADWVSKFIPDKRERFFGSGFGSELFGRFFRIDRNAE